VVAILRYRGSREIRKKKKPNIQLNEPRMERGEYKRTKRQIHDMLRCVVVVFEGESTMRGIKPRQDYHPE
jgi:hypothetical protein